MDRLDGKGFHPTVRPYRPHRKREHSKLKATKIALSITKQLEVLWTKFGAYTTEKGERVLNKLIDLVVLDSNETAMVPICGGEINYGAAGDYSMQHADPSRPPPNQGWMQKVLRYAAVFFVTALVALFAHACKKPPVPDPNPNPNQPTLVVPTKEITIVWSWQNNPTPGWAPPKDSIKYYTDQDSVKCVFINIIGRDGVGFPVNCTGYEPAPFHRARDTLQTRIDIDSTKVSLLGSFYALNANAQNHGPDQAPGITWYDKEWFERHGMTVLLLYKPR